MIDRPLTLAPGGFRLDAAFAAAQISVCGDRAGIIVVCESSTGTALSLGGAWSPVHDLELGVVAIPLSLSPSFEYNNPSIYGTYRFYHVGNVQIGGTVAITLPVRSGTDLGISLGAPLWWNFSSVAQLRTGLTISLAFSSPIVDVFTVPLLFNIQLADNFALQPATGFSFSGNDAGDTFAIPLGIGGLFTVAGTHDHPLVDLTASFTFPDFIVPNASGNPQTNLWIIGVGAQLYFLR